MTYHVVVLLYRNMAVVSHRPVCAIKRNACLSGAHCVAARAPILSQFSRGDVLPSTTTSSVRDLCVLAALARTQCALRALFADAVPLFCSWAHADLPNATGQWAPAAVLASHSTAAVEVVRCVIGMYQSNACISPAERVHCSRHHASAHVRFALHASQRAAHLFIMCGRSSLLLLLGGPRRDDNL